MKVFKTLPDQFSRKGITYKKTELTERECLGICRLSGKKYRRAKQTDNDKVYFYLEVKDVGYVERVEWEDVRRDCKYPIEDDNEGYIYGLNLTDFEGEGDILDVQWSQDSSMLASLSWDRCSPFWAFRGYRGCISVTKPYTGD